MATIATGESWTRPIRPHPQRAWRWWTRPGSRWPTRWRCSGSPPPSTCRRGENPFGPDRGRAALVLLGLLAQPETLPHLGQRVVVAGNHHQDRSPETADQVATGQNQVG